MHRPRRRLDRHIRARGAHLRLEVRGGANTFGARRNSLRWLEPWSGSGVIAGRLVEPEGSAWQGVTVTLVDKGGALLNTWTYRDDPDHLAIYELAAVWTMLVSWALFHWGYARVYHGKYLRAAAPTAIGAAAKMIR